MAFDNISVWQTRTPNAAGGPNGGSVFEVNPTTGLAYLGLGGWGNAAGVAVIDPKTARLVQRIDGQGAEAVTVAVDPSTNLIYDSLARAIGGDPNVPSTFNRVVSTITVAATADLIAANPRSHAVYAVSQPNDSPNFAPVVSVVDGNPTSPTYGQLMASLDLGSVNTVIQNYYGAAGYEASALSVDPIKNIAYVMLGSLSPASNFPGMLFTLDGTTLAVRAVTATTIPGGNRSGSCVGCLPAGPEAGATVNPNTGRIFVADSSGRNQSLVLLDRPPASATTAPSTMPVVTTTSPASITFTAVVAAGTTTVQQVDPSAAGLPPPGGFSLSGSLAYEVSTTASISGPIELCFDVSSVNDQTAFNSLSVLHGEGGGWVDRTVSRDFSSRTICASVSSLSPFLIAGPTTPPDVTPPTTVASATPGGAWSTTNAIVSFAATDNPGGSGVKQVAYVLSGAQSGSGIIASASGSVTVVAEGVTTVGFQATDNAGNVEAEQTLVVRIDRTSPVLSISNPTSATYTLNRSAVTGYACVDSGSGVASCQGPVPSGAPLPTSSVGLQNFTVTARDVAGNTAAATVSYTVQYGVSALYDQTQGHKSGSTVPVKLQLTDAAGVNVSSSSVVVTATVVALVGSTNTAATDDSGSANPDLGFRYDTTSNSYVFNLSTKGLAVGVYQLQFMVAGDPTVHVVGFVVGK